MLVSEFESSCYHFVICKSSFRAGEKFPRGRCLNLFCGSITSILGSQSLSLPHTGRSGFSVPAAPSREERNLCRHPVFLKPQPRQTCQKAVLKHPHSRRWRDCRAFPNLAKRLDCVRFTAAVPDGRTLLTRSCV